MRHLAMILLAASCAQAQDMRLLPPACGLETVNFDVNLDKTMGRPTPETGKALVYVVQNQFYVTGCLKCPATVRVGLDGAWMGANKKLSWLSFQVAPGAHHLCADLQPTKAAIGPERVALTSFTAEAGTTYYFRVQLIYGEGGSPFVDLQPVNKDEGQLLVLSFYPSSSHPKK